jgi:formylglycine-generating enzyme required for sulfatase activity
MRRWFLSHNSQDLALAQGFEEAFRRKEPDARIFVAPRALRLGGFWLPELAREIAEASAFLLLVGRNGLGPWQVLEYFEVTFAEWDACFYLGGCSYLPGDQGWGRGRQPVVNVSWDDVQKYVAWIARRTGKPYRLLSEAEWEYAARAGSDTAYSWGDEIGRGNANCESCGSKWDNRQTAPVGSFTTNAFGLHDMHGNVWEWVQDCFRHNYEGAPTDGLPNEVGDCSTRVIRGGSWSTGPQTLRAADRVWQPRNFRASSSNGFRVARALAP